LAPFTVNPSTVVVLGSPVVKLMQGNMRLEPSRVVTDGPSVEMTLMSLPLNVRPPVYVPGCTSIRSPLTEALIAAWMLEPG
jgi:hypothetical protein